MEKSTKGKWAFVINPVAGGGKSLIVEKELRKQLKQGNIEAEIFTTLHKAHAAELAKELAEKDFNYIVAVGGDGTVNEMASVLVDFPQINMALIPAGTGNDFAQIIGMSEHFEQKDWDILFEAKTHNVDVGRCNGNLFFNGMGLGFDAQVAAENYSPDGEVKQGGKGKYIWHILKNLLFFKEQKMSITTKGETSTNICFLNTISIVRRFAGGFYLTPKAYADDALLDVCMVDKINLLQRLSILLKVPKGEHLSHPKVHYYQSNKISIELEKEVAYHLDGELFFDKKFEIDILPSKISFIYNPGQANYFSK